MTCLAGGPANGTEQVDRQRKHDGRVLLGRDLVERLQITQRHGAGLLGEHRRGLRELLRCDHDRIEKAGAPVVAVNLPVGLANLIFDSLPDDARRELKLKGYDADDFWSRLRKLGPTEILKIEGDNGERIQIWLE